MNRFIQILINIVCAIRGHQWTSHSRWKNRRQNIRCMRCGIKSYIRIKS